MSEKQDRPLTSTERAQVHLDRLARKGRERITVTLPKDIIELADRLAQIEDTSRQVVLEDAIVRSIRRREQKILETDIEGLPERPRRGRPRLDDK